MNVMVMVGQDMGESFYSDNTGNKSISNEQRSKYFSDVIDFEWNKISKEVKD